MAVWGGEPSGKKADEHRPYDQEGGQSAGHDDRREDDAQQHRFDLRFGCLRLLPVDEVLQPHVDWGEAGRCDAAGCCVRRTQNCSDGDRGARGRRLT
jgi:hypothetical protein